MKKWLSLLCAVWVLLGMNTAFSEEGKMNQDAWKEIQNALAADFDNPVPKEQRILIGNSQLSPYHEKNLEAGFSNVVLLSTDSENIKENFGRSLAIMACRVNLDTGEARALLLPRNALTLIEEKSKSTELKYVNCFGGPLLTLREINESLNLSMDRYMAVNMDMVSRMVDAVGGVTLNLSESEAQALGLPSGEQNVSGPQALSYATLRRGYESTARMLNLLSTLLSKVKGLEVKEALNLVDVILLSSDTNLTVDDVIDLVFALFGQETPGEIRLENLPMDEDGTLGPAAREKAFDFMYGVEEEE